MPDFEDNELAVLEKDYTVRLSHEQIRSLIKWIPKNYESEPHEEGGALIRALNDAKEIKNNV
ncbi:MAG: hypothetical protein ACE5HI_01985 [bacterium]